MIVRVEQVSCMPLCEGNEDMRTAKYNNVHYLAAFDGDEVIGHICHRYDAPLWWTDQLFVAQKHRDRGIALLLIECNYHAAFDKTLELWGRVKMNGSVSPDTFARNNERFALGSDVRMHAVGSRTFYYVQRSLKPLKEQIASGVVKQIQFPHQQELP